MNNKLILSFLDEYIRYKDYIDGAIIQLDKNQFNIIIGDSSVAMYVAHLGGNLKSRFTDFLSSDGEKPWRDRDGEFDIESLTMESSLQSWNEGWKTLNNTLESLQDSDLEKIVQIRGKQLSVSSALTRSLSHTSYHVGQIVLLAKILVGKSWTTLSVVRNDSKFYNTDPKLEKRLFK